MRSLVAAFERLGFPGGAGGNEHAAAAGDIRCAGLIPGWDQMGGPGLIPGWKYPLEKDKATHSSILAWKIPWTEKLGGLQSMGPPRVRHD